MLKIGSHIGFSSPGYLYGAAEESIKNGANTMMIYLGAPQSARRVDISKYRKEEYMSEFSEKIKPEDIVIHAPYITNPANPEKAEFAVKLLIEDVERMNYFGAKHMVLHPGAHTKFDRKDAINTLIKSLITIFDKTTDVEISLETMAGKGTEIGTSFEELKYIVDQVNNPRLNICLDTCHAWDSGIDITDFEETIKQLKKHDLFKLIKVIHVNDSKNDLGGAKDRHENLGKGYIGLEPLKKIVNAPEFDGVLMILETPWVDGVPIYDKEIEMLKAK